MTTKLIVIGIAAVIIWSLLIWKARKDWGNYDEETK